MADKLRMMKVRLEAMKKNLQSASQSEKGKHVTLTMADRFNETLKAIGEAHTDAKEYLPSPIKSSHPHSMLNLADATYLDLEIFIEETIALISELESGE